MIIDIFLIIVSIIFSVIGINFAYFRRKNIGNILIFYLNGLIYLFFGIFFYPFFFLSTLPYFSEINALAFWNLSIVFWLFSLSMLSIIHKLIISFEKKPGFLTLFYSLIIGIILGLSFYSEAFTLTYNSGIVSFSFNNLLLLIFLLGFNFLIIGVFCYNLIKFYSKIRNATSKKMLFILTAQFSIMIILYSVFILTQHVIFKYLYGGFYLIGAFFATYYIFKKPFLFVELTNKIYDGRLLLF